MRKNLQELLDYNHTTTNRLDAFSDGVFAIVITLLVLELHVPELTGGAVSEGLRQELIHLFPKFISFVVSFLYISIYWINHHQLFHYLKRSDRTLFWLNSFFLMCLTFIPFPTALIGSYPQEPLAVICYGVAMMVTAISFVIMKAYIFSGSGLIDPTTSTPPVLFYIVAGPLLYLMAIFLATTNTSAAIAIYIATPIIYIFARG
jgi:uncharacterized membrane protein